METVPAETGKEVNLADPKVHVHEVLVAKDRLVHGMFHKILVPLTYFI